MYGATSAKHNVTWTIIVDKLLNDLASVFIFLKSLNCICTGLCSVVHWFYWHILVMVCILKWVALKSWIHYLILTLEDSHVIISSRVLLLTSNSRLLEVSVRQFALILLMHLNRDCFIYKSSFALWLAWGKNTRSLLVFCKRSAIALDHNHAIGYSRLSLGLHALRLFLLKLIVLLMLSSIVQVVGYLIILIIIIIGIFYINCLRIFLIIVKELNILIFVP